MYANEAKCVDPYEGRIPDNLTELLNEIRGQAVDSLMLARAINKHLFNISDPKDVNSADPKCFKDVMKSHLDCLLELQAELKLIASQVGL